MNKAILAFTAVCILFAIGCTGKQGAKGDTGQAGPAGRDAASCVVRPNEDIQTCVDAVLNSGGGTVFVSVGTYTITTAIHVWGSNLILEGEGTATRIVLGSNAQTSNIVVGPIDSVNPDTDSNTRPLENVTIRDLAIDGNMASQPTGTSGEHWLPPYEYISVSGITIRYANNVTVSNVSVKNARSAGILVEKSTTGFLLDNVDVEQSFFDGFSCNKSYHGTVANSRFINNGYAGITATCDCSDNILSNNDISSNGTSTSAPGVYLADAHRNQFSDNMLESNSDVGVKLTGGDCGTGSTGASLNYFANNDIFSNQSCGVYLDTANGGLGSGNKADGTFYHANGYDGVCRNAYDDSYYQDANALVAP